MKQKRQMAVMGRLNHLAYNKIKEMILNGRISHEKPIVERAISQELNMSRTPIKHALSRLQQEGLIRIQPRHGVFPTLITYMEYQNILQVREVLEGLAARLSVDHFSNADLRELRAIFDGLGGDIRDVNLVSHEAFALANVAFHRKILQMSKNPKLIETVHNIYDHLSLVRLQTIERTGRRNRAVDEHEEIMKALEARDPDKAEAAMRAHVRSLKKDIEGEVQKNPDFFGNNNAQ